MKNEKINLNPLVSIITPCLNGEGYVRRLLNSILEQSYKNIELIFINDGSTDRTEEIVKSYVPQFDVSGMKLIYIHQENSGQAASLNRGLELFSGKYLSWVDSDDWLPRESIEKKVAFLEEHPDYALVRTNGFFYKEGRYDLPIRAVSKADNRFNEYIFEDLLFERTFNCCGCYMVRTSAFKKVNPECKILANYGSQNWQMEIPISYNNKCGFIDLPLYCITERAGSFSRQKRNEEQKLKRFNSLYEIKVWAVNQVCPENANLLDALQQMHEKQILYVAMQFNDHELLKQMFLRIKDRKALDMRDRIIYLLGITGVGKILYHLAHYILGCISRL